MFWEKRKQLDDHNSLWLCNHSVKISYHIWHFYVKYDKNIFQIEIFGTCIYQPKWLRNIKRCVKKNKPLPVSTGWEIKNPKWVSSMYIEKERDKGQLSQSASFLKASFQLFKFANIYPWNGIWLIFHLTQTVDCEEILWHFHKMMIFKLKMIFLHSVSFAMKVPKVNIIVIITSASLKVLNLNQVSQTKS